MAKRICLLTSNETICNSGCYNCDCGGEVAFNNCYVSIYDVQRLCDIVKHMETVSVEGEEIAEYMRNELERMVVEKSDVKRGRWVSQLNGHVICTFCGKEQKFSSDFCKHCGADMRDATKG